MGEMICGIFRNLYPIDYIFVAMILCWGIGLGVAMALKMKFPKPRKPAEGDDEVKYIAEKARKSWLVTCWVWQSVYYLMIIGSLVCTIIVLYISCYMDVKENGIVGRIFIYSAFSIVFNMVPYMVDLRKISSAYHAAHRLVNGSLLRGEDVADAVIRGEEIIREGFDGSNANTIVTPLKENNRNP